MVVVEAEFFDALVYLIDLADLLDVSEVEFDYFGLGLS